MEIKDSVDALAYAKSLANLARAGVITYEVAKQRSEYFLDIVNKKGKEISRKYGKKYYPVTFSKLAR